MLPLLLSSTGMEQDMATTQEIQDTKQNTNHLFSLAQKAAKQAVLNFEAVVLVLSEFAAYDNRWQFENEPDSDLQSQ